MIEKKAYKLINQIQYYDWGTKNENAFIPKLLDLEIERDKPYAELWIGAHPKAPSYLFINEQKISLIELIEKYPDQILGKQVTRKFNNKLPYLLKILSSSQALSIQAHPNKELAKKLHKKDPINYPDDNHKPEIAIAVDYLNAIVGFKPVDEFIKTCKNYNSLSSLLESCKSNKEGIIKEYYSIIINLSQTELVKIIDQLLNQIKNTKQKSDEELVFIEQFEKFGYDVGLISILLFNYVQLKSGEAIFTDAGIPHAYIKGNIIECMANSDNVVRAGLTPKFKDVDTLLDMMKFEGGKVTILSGQKNNGERNYSIPIDEFEISIIELEAGETKHFEDIGLVTGLLLEGNLQINCESGIDKFKKGESFIIPALIEKIELKSSIKSKLVFVTIPSSSTQ
ncbi:MAG: mannose-6-phosphate isomerase, class I [Melioribacteraceae bacterium]|jgi:mannose-6-phosphate isomerase|nr:MAG: mannose-6-phosphate isomerase, class I [Melioribacteraceae bacterium]